MTDLTMDPRSISNKCQYLMSVCLPICQSYVEKLNIWRLIWLLTGNEYNFVWKLHPSVIWSSCKHLSAIFHTLHFSSLKTLTPCCSDIWPMHLSRIWMLSPYIIGSEWGLHNREKSSKLKDQKKLCMEKNKTKAI